MLVGQIRDRLKQKAVALRKKGFSYPMIGSQLGVGHSTLSGWCSKLSLSKLAEKKIFDRKKEHLVSARKLAIRALRISYIRQRQEITNKTNEELSGWPLNKIDKEALLAMLYLGEGFKKKSLVGLGNSNPDILSLYVKLLRDIYSVRDEEFRCFLYLRYDQDVEIEEVYWSKVLKIPRSQFRKANLDRRTAGKKTWEGYHGVCAVYCYNARIEKRLTAMQQGLIKKLLNR